MTYIVDIIFVVIFALVIIISAKKGFFRSFIDFAGSMIGAFAARKLAADYAKPVFEAYFAPGAEKLLAQNLGSAASTDYTVQIENAINSLPQELDGVLQIIGIDSQSVMNMATENGVNLNGDNLVESLMNTVVNPIGTAVLQFILFAVMAVVFIFGIKIFAKLFDKLFKKLPVVKGINRTLGGVFGILRGLVVVVIISMLVSIVASFTTNEMLIDCVDNSIIINAVSGTLSTLIGINI